MAQDHELPSMWDLVTAVCSEDLKASGPAGATALAWINEPYRNDRGELTDRFEEALIELGPTPISPTYTGHHGQNHKAVVTLGGSMHTVVIGSPRGSQTLLREALVNGGVTDADGDWTAHRHSTVLVLGDFLAVGDTAAANVEMLEELIRLQRAADDNWGQLIVLRGPVEQRVLSGSGELFDALSETSSHVDWLRDLPFAARVGHLFCVAHPPSERATATLRDRAPESIADWADWFDAYAAAAGDEFFGDVDLAEHPADVLAWLSATVCDIVLCGTDAWGAATRTGAHDNLLLTPALAASTAALVADSDKGTLLATGASSTQSLLRDDETLGMMRGRLDVLLTAERVLEAVRHLQSTLEN